MQLSILDDKRIDRWNKILANTNTFMTVPKIADMLECSKDTMLRDCVMLADLGYLEVQELKMVRGKAVAYKATKPVLDLKDYVPFEARPTKSYVRKQEVQPESGNGIYRLTDKVHWTKRATPKTKVYISSTFNMV